MKRMSLGLLCVFAMTSICYAEDIDVFWLVDKGTPQQLQDAVEHGAKFNVERNIYDFGDDEDIDLNGWLFDHGETPLHRAATYNRNPESIRFLISQGVDVNAEASRGNTSPETPLICAVRKNTIEVIRELLKGGANPNHEGTENIFKIVTDERGKDIPTYKAIVEALVEAGGNVNAHWEVKPEERTPILLPRSQWKSSNPLDNMRDDLSNVERANFSASCTPLMFAIFNDNPDIVNILLDVSADVNILNAENKCALDYANDLPEDSKLKQSPVFGRLKAATATNTTTPTTAKAEDTKGEKPEGEKKLGAKTSNLFSAAQLEKLVNEGKVPAYVGDKGEFSYNPDLGSILITGDGVRLRSQPNTKANVVGQLNKIMWGSIDYLGTWTHPDGSRWNIGIFDEWNYYPEETPEAEKKVVFVSAQFSKAVTNKEYRDYLAANQIGGADAGYDSDSGTASSGGAYSANIPTFTLDEIATQLVKNPRKFSKDWMNKKLVIKGKVDSIMDVNRGMSSIHMDFSGYVNGKRSLAYIYILLKSSSPYLDDVETGREFSIGGTVIIVEGGVIPKLIIINEDY